MVPQSRDSQYYAEATAELQKEIDEDLQVEDVVGFVIPTWEDDMLKEDEENEDSV